MHLGGGVGGVSRGVPAGGAVLLHPQPAAPVAATCGEWSSWQAGSSARRAARDAAVPAPVLRATACRRHPTGCLLG